MITSATAQPAEPAGQDYRELDKHSQLCVCSRCGNAVGDTAQHDAWHRYVEQVRGRRRG